MGKRYYEEAIALPPPEVRFYDPLGSPADEQFPTAVDSRGLVNIPHLIEDVSATVDPEYVWPPGLKNHHFYWPAHLYPPQPEAEGNLGAFRNLPSNRGLLPVAFEQWLHLVTLQPEIPEKEVRQYCIEAWSVAHSLFTMAKETIIWERRARARRALMESSPHLIGKKIGDDDEIAEEYMTEVFTRNFSGLDMHIERNERIPAEFRLVEHNRPTHEIVRQLSAVVAKRALNLVPTVRAA